MIKAGPDSAFDFRSFAPEFQELAVSAAVRERFRPSELLQDWIRRHGETVSDDVVDKALDASLSLASVSDGTSEADDAYQLPLDLRQQVLGLTGLGAVRATLKRLPPRTQAEQIFAGLVSGRLPNLDELGRGELLALATGAAWAKDIKGVRQIAAIDIERRLRDQEFVERVGGADLSQFVGRAALLRALAELWKLPKRPTVLIEGPGGIGKSIAVARFFQTLLSQDSDPERPDAIFHLDFDLPELQRASYRTLATEIVRQLALRWAPSANERLLSLLRTFGGIREGGGTANNASFAIESTRDFRDHFDPSGLIGHAFDIFTDMRGGPLRVILFVDSFERAENLGETAAINITAIADHLRNLGIDVMLIFAARAYRYPEMLDRNDRPSVQRVPRFRQAEAIDYLVGRAERRGIRLSRMDADRANRSLNGWPLGLRMAISMLGTKTEDFDVEAWLASIQGGGRSVQATLYERLLERIENKDLRKLAKPGLLVRRITAEIIQTVLAEPCGLVGRFDGNLLMRMAEDEGQLFQHDPTDPGALWHRQDLREIMLPVLRKDIAPAVARLIHDGAIDYYATQPGDVARAEELYHRLVRGDDRGEIAARWTDAAGQRLLGALGELSPRSAALVRQLAGGGRSDAARDMAEADVQLDELRAVANNRLNDGNTDLGDIFEIAGVPQAILSPLGDVQAQRLLRQGRHAEVLDGAAALPGNRSVPSAVKARVYLTAASLAEGLGNAARAQEFWYLAQRLSRYLAPAEKLNVRIALARVSRLTGLMIRRRREHIRASCALLVAQASEIRTGRVIKLEAVAELSEVFHWPAKRQQTIDPNARDVLLMLFRDLSPLFPSALGNPERLAQLATILGQYPGSVRSPFELDKHMQLLFGSHDPRDHDSAVDALRSEVDCAFAAAAGRSAFGQALASADSLAYS